MDETPLSGTEFSEDEDYLDLSLWDTTHLPPEAASLLVQVRQQQAVCNILLQCAVLRGGFAEA